MRNRFEIAYRNKASKNDHATRKRRDKREIKVAKRVRFKKMYKYKKEMTSR
jgi:hypothetical protein